MRNVRGRGEQGFTLIELVATLIIIAGLLALLVPNVSLVLGKKQAVKAMNDCRRVGDAMACWILLNGGSPASSSPTNVGNYSPVTRATLESLLVPKYLASVPERDGYGNLYEYFLDTANPTGLDAVLCRSSGRDGVFAGPTYFTSTFPVSDFDQDIVWADGNFVRWPG